MGVSTRATRPQPRPGLNQSLRIRLGPARRRAGFGAGLTSQYGSKNPFAFRELQDVQELSNFFERKVSSCQVGVTGTLLDRTATGRGRQSKRGMTLLQSWFWSSTRVRALFRGT